MADKPYNMLTAFAERLALEQGAAAVADWRSRAKSFAESGLRGQPALQKAAYEFGLIDPQDERRRYNERHGLAPHVKPPRVAKKKPLTPDEQQQAIMEAAESLPPIVSPLVEADWVRGHAALLRKALRPDEMLIVTVEDVLEAKNGPAPSQAAVTALQTWVNKPDEFQKWYQQKFAKQIQDREAGEAFAAAASGELSEAMSLEFAYGILGELSEQAEALARQAIPAA